MIQTNKQRGVKTCEFCMNALRQIDYKNTQVLSRYLSSYSKIVPRKRSKVCSRHQRKLSMAIKRARFMALVPYSEK